MNKLTLAFIVIFSASLFPADPSFGLTAGFEFVSSNFDGIDVGGYAAPATSDIDNDGLIDLIIGNEDGYILHFEQDSLNSLTFSRTSSALDSLKVSGYAQPVFTDIDGDGLLDLLVGKSGGWIARFEQDAPNSYIFNEITQSFSLIDPGSNSALTVSDIDGDGLLDILCGNSAGKIYHYKQDSVNSASFSLVTNNFNSIDIGDYSVPRLRDIDNDGLIDLIIGKSGGYIEHYEQAEVNSAVFNYITNRLVAEDTGFNSSPCFDDIDNDGLTDLLAGNLQGVMCHFEEIEPFTDIDAGLQGVSLSSAEWGDYDNDGDLDIALTGSKFFDSYWHTYSKIYRNDSGVFNNYNAGLRSVMDGSVTWGDYDNDGDLDLHLTGRSYPNAYSIIYRNDSGIFSNINAGFTGVSDGCSAWGDYDNDGDLDLIVTGWDISYDDATFLYRNDGNDTFIEIDAGLPVLSNGSVKWGDYDNDGDLDLLLTGLSITKTVIGEIYRNDGNDTFTNINSGLPYLQLGSVDWGDYDNDGDLDILYSGVNGPTVMSRIYRNDSGVFTDIEAGLTGLCMSSAQWGDYDNDGDLDILLTGDVSTSQVTKLTKIYRNDHGEFVDINAGLKNVREGSVAWGDYDNDGDLDILLTGSDFSNIYRNNCIVKNTNPEMPGNISCVNNVTSLSLFWDRATDAETPQEGLSYNVVMGYNENLIITPMSDISTGYRLIPSVGNACQNNTFVIPFATEYPQVPLPDFWGVQAIDHSFAGSDFNIQTIDLGGIQYLDLMNNPVMEPVDLLSWEMNSVEAVKSYQIQIDTDSLFSGPVLDENIVIASGKLITDKGYYSIALNELADYESLQNNAVYYWRIKPQYYDFTLTVFSEHPSKFLYDPQYYPPSSISIEVSGNFAVISWGSAKEAKGESYNVYSSEDPYAVFPSEWLLEATVSNTTLWITQISDLKKFYCVTSAVSAKTDK